MTEEKIQKIFESDLGSQLHEIFSASDDRVFIRFEEAKSHAEGKLDPGTLPLEDKTIFIWYNEF